MLQFFERELFNADAIGYLSELKNEQSRQLDKDFAVDRSSVFFGSVSAESADTILG